MMQVLQPPGWARPKGYSNGIATRGGKLVFVAGQVGWSGDGNWREAGVAVHWPGSETAARNLQDKRGGAE